MADKYKSSINDATDWVLIKFGATPETTASDMLVRPCFGIDRSKTDDLMLAMRHLTSNITDPVINYEPWTGSWRRGEVWAEPNESGSYAGSDTIFQELKVSLFDTASTANRQLERITGDVIEQPENPWMYYEFYRKTTTYRFVNMTEAAAATAYDVLYRILVYKSGGTDWYLNALTNTYYEGAIIYNQDQYSALWTKGRYYQISDAGPGRVVTEVTNPKIEGCQYEREQDGAYSLIISTSTQTDTAIERHRTMQYGGHIYLLGFPIEDDTYIYLTGMNDETTRIYANSKLTIGGETYMVVADADVLTGNGAPIALGTKYWKPTLSPPISLATENYVDAFADETDCEIYFAAVY